MPRHSAGTVNDIDEWADATKAAREVRAAVAEQLRAQVIAADVMGSAEVTGRRAREVLRAERTGGVRAGGSGGGVGRRDRRGDAGAAPSGRGVRGFGDNTVDWTDERGFEWYGSPRFVDSLKADEAKRRRARERADLPRPPSRKARRALKRGVAA